MTTHATVEVVYKKSCFFLKILQEGMELAQTKINEIINQVLDEEGLTPKELVIGGFRQFFPLFLVYTIFSKITEKKVKEVL